MHRECRNTYIHTHIYIHGRPPWNKFGSSEGPTKMVLFTADCTPWMCVNFRGRLMATPRTLGDLLLGKGTRLRGTVECCIAWVARVRACMYVPSLYMIAVSKLSVCTRGAHETIVACSAMSMVPRDVAAQRKKGLSYVAVLRLFRGMHVCSRCKTCLLQTNVLSSGITG